MNLAHNGLNDTQERRVPARQVGKTAIGMEEREAFTDQAIEFRNRLATAFRRPFPASILFDHPSLDRLCDHIEAAVFPKETSEAPTETSAPGSDLLADLEQLSEDEVDRMLGSRMNT